MSYRILVIDQDTKVNKTNKTVADSRLIPA